LKEPEPRRLVPASGDNSAAIGADRHRIDPSVVAPQHHGASSRIFCPQIPEARRLVLASGDNPAPIRLTPAQFEQLADVPPEEEWLANITNLKTRRAYKGYWADSCNFIR